MTTGQICAVSNQTAVHLLKLNRRVNVSEDLGQPYFKSVHVSKAWRGAKSGRGESVR